MNERPWQSNLWREIYSVPKSEDPVQAYFKLKGGEVVRGMAILEYRYKGTRGEVSDVRFVDLDRNPLEGITAWQPVLGLANKSPADRLPVEEEIFNDLVKPHGWTSMEYAPQGNITSWILTTHGKVEEAKCYLDEKNRPYWGPDEGCRLKAVAWKQRVHGGEKPERPDRKTGRWPDQIKAPSSKIAFDSLNQGHGINQWHPLYTITTGMPTSKLFWVLTETGSIIRAVYLHDSNTWVDEDTCPLQGLVAWSSHITRPTRPPLKDGVWPGEVERPAEHEHALKDWFKGSDSGSHEPVTVVIDADRDLHLGLPNGPWRHKSYLPQRLEEGDEDLCGELVWALQLDGSIVQAKATRDPSGNLRWIVEGPENHTVAWQPYVSGDLNLKLPLLYHGATRSPVSWETLLEWGELKGPGAYPSAADKQPARGLSWLADLLEHIVPPLAKAFREEPPAKTFQPGDKAKPAEDVNRPLHEELKEIGKVVEAAKKAEPEPVEKSPVDNRDWTQGMYKTANDYEVPPIPGYDELSREHHEGIVRSVLRDLIREKTRDQTLDEYLANFTPMEFYILQGLATGQEHFVDTKGLAAFNYDRLYRSGFITRVSVTFGPRLDRNTRQGMGGGGSGTGNVPSRAYASGGGCGYEVWVLTPLGQQFMAYLLARDNRRYVAKNRSDQSK